MILYFTVVAVLSTAMFSSTIAAPTVDMADIEILSHAISQALPDPGIGDWFTKHFEILLPKIKDYFRDPSNVKKFEERFKPYRDLAEIGIKFLEKYYSDETVTMNIVHAIKSFLAELDKLINENVSDKYIVTLLQEIN